MSKKACDWPEDIQADYERIRPLGEGAFGIVWLAKAKKNRPETAALEWQAKTKLKQINAVQDGEKQYAAREIAILKEINHPNIIQCMRSVKMPGSHLLVLTLADGPDLNELVEMGGALSVSLSRLAARHLIAAVAYLHGRGVIHRDIKPANCVLTKANTPINKYSNETDWVANDALWDDTAVFDETEWKIILVDFGFARALTPEEVGFSDDLVSSSSERRRSSVSKLAQLEVERQAILQNISSPPLKNDPLAKHDNAVERKPSFAKCKTRRNSSFARTPIRAMSSLGTRAFAAPEVMNVRRKSDGDGDEALSSHVSDYGFLADAYSIGCTIKVLLTGVPAEENETEFISSQGADAQLSIISTIFSCRKKGNRTRKKRYKLLLDTPKRARLLVWKLTKPISSDRLTVPKARNEIWIKGGINTDDPVVTLPMGDIPAGNDDPIKCLNCSGGLSPSRSLPFVGL
ncbi:hypothetical protein ACHAXR_005164 [Thalassiosira sp. AJA248-18]